MIYNIYSVEFKLSVVQEFFESGLSIREFAKERGINRNTFYAWVRKYKRNMDDEPSKALIDIKHDVYRYVHEEAGVKEHRTSMLNIEVNGVKINFDIKDLKQIIEVLKA